MDSVKNSIEFPRDSKGIDGNGDGHLHLSHFVNGEMGMATSTLEKMWMTTCTLNKMQMDTPTYIRRGMATHTLGNKTRILGILRTLPWSPPGAQSIPNDTQNEVQGTQNGAGVFLGACVWCVHSMEITIFLRHHENHAIS